MQHIRTVKPDFFTSEDIVALSPFARLLYIATWCEADREGRLVWKPGTFKLRYFPGDALDINAVAEELITRGLVVQYGDGLAYIPKFQKHQHINPRETVSSLPDQHASRRVTTRHDAQGGREGKVGDDASRRVPEKSGLNGSFAEFWEAYPRKTAKGAAEKAWIKIQPDRKLAGCILQAIERAKASTDWQKDDGQFVPHPATWLGRRQWEDELPLRHDPDRNPDGSLKLVI